MSDADTLIGRVLVVEDDEDIADVLRRSLRQEGHEVRTAGDGEEALGMAAEFVPDLVILDLGLPKLDGVEVCRKLRAAGDVPILILTARSDTGDRVEGLDAGADDYVAKPFALDELLARIRALLRRSSGDVSSIVRFEDLVIDPRARTAHRDGRDLQLTKTEFDLLLLLARSPGIVIDRDTIYEEIWGIDFLTSSNSLDVYIGYLRRKTEAEGGSRLIHTVRGVGYVLRSGT
jgi:two-component system response regulator MprA